eukprot:GHVS01086165.1.p2 GENE.GHVS01086165.1~~GHVS01086165.1.p2  ORF type:complete len:149 (+),score=37.23 GHVS01086165.1:51-497(+)
MEMFSRTFVVLFVAVALLTCLTTDVEGVCPKKHQKLASMEKELDSLKAEISRMAAAKGINVEKPVPHREIEESKETKAAADAKAEARKADDELQEQREKEIQGEATTGEKEPQEPAAAGEAGAAESSPKKVEAAEKFDNTVSAEIVTD